MARQDLDREIAVIAEALRQHGALEREELKRLVGGRYWGPGRFRAALRAAVAEGLARRRSRAVYGPGPGSGRGELKRAPAEAATPGAASRDVEAGAGTGKTRP